MIGEPFLPHFGPTAGREVPHRAFQPRRRGVAQADNAPPPTVGPVAGDDVAGDQVDQMRLHRAAGGAAQRRVEPDIEPFDDRVDVSTAGFQAVEMPALALAAMRDEGADMSLRLGDRRAVRRPVDRIAARPAACRARPYRPPCRRPAAR